MHADIVLAELVDDRLVLAREVIEDAPIEQLKNRFRLGQAAHYVLDHGWELERDALARYLPLGNKTRSVLGLLAILFEHVESNRFVLER